MAKATGTYLYGGGNSAVKVINPNSFPDEAWKVIAGEDDSKNNKSENLYSTVGYLRRCIDVRCATLSAIPWQISRANADEDADALWTHDMRERPKLFDYFPYIEEIIYLSEACLMLSGEVFWYKVGFPRRPQLKWFMPSTMRAKWDKEEGLVGFERRLPNSTEADVYELDEIAYFYFANPFHETKPLPPLVLSVLADAGVVSNLDAFIEDFFKRGAIKMTLLTVDRTVPDLQRRALKSWWQRVAKGIKSAWDVMILSSSVNATVIGEGVADLGNMQLTEQKQKSIATGIGVPHSIIMSDAANRATSETDVRNLYEFTLLPEARILQRLLNDQIFDDLGLYFEFLPETLSVFQTDENERSAAFKSYVDAGLKKSLVAEMLGLQLPSGIEYEDLDEVDEPAPTDPNQDVTNQDSNTTGQSQTSDEVQTEAKRFRAWAKRRLERSTFDVAKFESDVLTEEDKLAIIDELKGGPGSGNFGHAGRPGKRGGSVGGGGHARLADRYGVYERGKEPAPGVFTYDQELTRLANLNKQKEEPSLADRLREKRNRLSKIKEETVAGAVFQPVLGKRDPDQDPDEYATEYRERLEIHRNVIATRDRILADSNDMWFGKKPEDWTPEDSRRFEETTDIFWAEKGEGFIKDYIGFQHAKAEGAFIHPVTIERDSDKMSYRLYDEVSKGESFLTSTMNPKVHEKVAVKAVERDRVKGKPYRANATGQTMNLDQSDKAWVVIHEYGHNLESGIGTPITSKRKAFVKRRHGSEPEVKLRDEFPNANYNDRETAVKDKWIHPYVGKNYGGAASEVVSMGMQMMFTNPLRLVREDPELFEFTLGVMWGSLSLK